MPNSKHLTHGISNFVSLITKTKIGLSTTVLRSIVPALIYMVDAMEVINMFKDCTKAWRMLNMTCGVQIAREVVMNN
jgi:hypothetical protein